MGLYGNKKFTLKVEKDYTPEEMIQILSGVTLSAGQPQLIKYALTNRIVFPALDKFNQVQIMKVGVKKWVVVKSDEASVSAGVTSSVLFNAIGYFSRIPALFSANSKKASKLAEDTYNEIKALNL